MCGLAGIVAADPERLRAPLHAMVAAQVHRGPDDEGHTVVAFGERFVGLGHRRLAILDLSSAGAQPMVHSDTGDVLIYNGEIYNYRVLRVELEKEGCVFTGESDTEVLLHALTRWGMGGLSRLQGMYTFAFLNRRDQCLYLARDPLGIKPLYWARAGDRFLFASEVRGLIASGWVGATPAPKGIAEVLAYGAAQSPDTLFEEIRCFPAGCWLALQPDTAAREQPRFERFWTYPKVEPVASPSERIAYVQESLDRAVRAHLASDVPLGVFLSSGIDSTVVAALAARHAPDVRTFTVGFSGHTEFDETREARETAQRLGTQHTEIPVDDAQALTDVDAWLASLDQPCMDGLNTYVISRAVRRAGTIVALSGQGGDELFGGYPGFVELPRLRRLMRWLAYCPTRMRSGLLRALGAGRSPAVRDKLADMGRGEGTLTALYLHRRRAMSDAQMEALGFGESGIAGGFLSPEARQLLPVEQEDMVADIANLESAHYLANTLLPAGDNSGMAHGLEIRVPLLDRGLLDSVLALPGDCRLPAGTASKHLLRAAFGTELGPIVSNRGKRGFVFPVGRWMQGPLRERCEHTLAALRDSGLVNAQGVADVWRAFLERPDTPVWSRAWTLFVLGDYLARADSCRA